MATPTSNISLFNSSNFVKPTSEENTDKITSNLRSINANQQAIIANVSSISANSASVTAEVLRAQAAESTLTTNLNAEILRAQGAESNNASAITAEEIRAQGAEGTLTTNVTALQTANTSNQSAIATLQSANTTNTSAIATLQSSDATNTSAIATLQSANTTNTSAIATLQSANTTNASAISAEESRAQGAEGTLTTNVTALQTANTTNTSAISTLESMIGTWDYATYGTLATYVLTLQSGGGGGGGGTSYSTYTVKVVTNVLNQSVYSIAAPSSNFYTQPVLSFGAGDQFLFDIQDATYSAASAALVFGTTVDNAATINTAVVSTVNNNILLTIDSAYSGSNLVYFDSGTANMGYVAPPSGTTYTVTVAGGVYSFASGGSTVTPTFTNGTTYIFDLADATNAGKQFVLGSTLDDTSTLFSTQTIMGTPGQTGAYVSYTIPNFNAVAYFDYTTTGMGATISQADYEYIVKTVTNVTGDVVYAFDTNGDGTFYNQPDMTFAVGSKYLFQTSQIASGYTLSFGTTVDGTPDTSVVTSGTNQLLVDLTAQTGNHYTYFDATNAGMGYVAPSGTIYNVGAQTTESALSTMLGNIGFNNNDYTANYSHYPDTYNENLTIPGQASATNASSDLYNSSTGQYLYQYPQFQSAVTPFGWGVPVLGGIKGTFSSATTLTFYYGTAMMFRTNLNMFVSGIYTPTPVSVLRQRSGVTTELDRTWTWSEWNNGVNAATNSAWGVADRLNQIQRKVTINVAAGDTIMLGDYGESPYTFTSNYYNAITLLYAIETPANEKVTVANGVFNIDGVAQPTLTFTSGETYVFDQSDSSNAGHPLVIGTTADDNTTLVTQTVVGTPGQAGAYTQFTATATTVYYFCYNHSGMGA